jgi:hypothetical protein
MMKEQQEARSILVTVVASEPVIPRTGPSPRQSFKSGAHAPAEFPCLRRNRPTGHY